MSGFHRPPVDAPHKGKVMRKLFPYHEVIVTYRYEDRRVVIDIDDVDVNGSSGGQLGCPAVCGRYHDFQVLDRLEIDHIVDSDQTCWIDKNRKLSFPAQRSSNAEMFPFDDVIMPYHGIIITTKDLPVLGVTRKCTPGLDMIWYSSIPPPSGSSATTTRTKDPGGSSSVTFQ